MGSKGEQGQERMVVTKLFDAPRELVWKAWTDARYVAQWWGPKGCTAPVCEMDFRVGGKFLFCMRAADGREFWTGGEYHEIVPKERIVFSLYPTDAAGNRVDPAAYGLQHEAIEGERDVIHFEDVGGGRTRLTMVGNETMEHAQESGQLEGWNEILEKLAAAVAGLVQAE